MVLFIFVILIITIYMYIMFPEIFDPYLYLRIEETVIFSGWEAPKCHLYIRNTN